MTTPWEELRDQIETVIRETAPANADVQNWARLLADNVAGVFVRVEDDWDEDYYALDVASGNSVVQRLLKRKLQASTRYLQHETITIPVTRTSIG
jgi:hypothetical protein